MVTAPYDEIADWYETEFLPHQRRGASESEYADGIGIDQALVELLGPGSGRCIEIGCGTGIYAERIRQLGWEPTGIDVSGGMLAHASSRLPVAQADAAVLPYRTASADAVVAIMVHSDLPDYASVLGEAYRVLRPGGVFLHIGVHPCFIGTFADRTDNDAVVIGPGYLDSGWTPPIGPEATEVGRSGQVRDKVGAAHYSLSELLNQLLDVGFVLEQTAEGFEPTPITLSLLATRQA